MKYPGFLSKGDVIGVTGPSAGVTEATDRARFANARRRLEERGYGVVETPDTFMCDEQGRSAPAEQRVEEMDSLYEDGSVKAIYAASGGDYEFEMLPLMDWDLIESNPKWFQGYSDNTTLLFKITAEHDVATVYGGNYGDFVWDYLPADLQEKLPREFFINYSKEATLGQELRLVGFRRDNEYLVEGVGPEGVCFSARCVF